MKNSFYFDHDYNARNDQKILDLRAEYGWDGYGKYFALLECLCESSGYIKRVALGGLSLGLSVDKESLTKLIDFCISLELFHENECGIYSKRIHEHLDYRKMLSEYGKRGGRGNKAVTLEEQEEKKPPFSHPLATPEAVKERKGNNSKEEIYSFEDFWNDYAKKEGMKKCKDKWGRISDSDKSKIKTHVPLYVNSTPVVQYRKMPITYLNGEHWNDELNVNGVSNQQKIDSDDFKAKYGFESVSEYLKQAQGL